MRCGEAPSECGLVPAASEQATHSRIKLCTCRETALNREKSRKILIKSANHHRRSGLTSTSADRSLHIPPILRLIFFVGICYVCHCCFNSGNSFRRKPFRSGLCARDASPVVFLVGQPPGSAQTPDRSLGCALDASVTHATDYGAANFRRPSKPR